MNERIILSVVAIIMLVLTLKKGDTRTRWLTSLLTVGILITWTGVSEIIFLGLIIYMFTSLLITFVNLKEKKLSRFFRITIIFSGLWTFIANFFLLLQLPLEQIIRISSIVPLILYAISLFKGIAKRKEVGYLTIMNVELLLNGIR
jgi:hypothetical protein